MCNFHLQNAPLLAAERRYLFAHRKPRRVNGLVLGIELSNQRVIDIHGAIPVVGPRAWNPGASCSDAQIVQMHRPRRVSGFGSRPGMGPPNINLMTYAGAVNGADRGRAMCSPAASWR